jgi:hypothetical protein
MLIAATADERLSLPLLYRNSLRVLQLALLTAILPQNQSTWALQTFSIF